MHKKEGNLKTSNSLQDSNTSKPCCQGAIPKIKFQNLNPDNKSSSSIKGLQNGSASEPEKNNKIHVGSSLLPSVSASTSQSSINKDLNDEIFELDLTEKNMFKCKSLISGNNDLKNCGRRRSRGISLDYENSSGNEGDDGLSADDCCIYTYKGDQFADLPNSFFPAETAGNESNPSQGDNQIRSFSRRNQAPVVERSSSGSSPDMDYLEMDFDPGPSLEQDSEEEVDGFVRKINNGRAVPDKQNEKLMDNNEDLNESIEESQNSEEPLPGPSNQVYKKSLLKTDKISDCNRNNYNRTKEMLNSCCTGFCSAVSDNENCDLLNNCVNKRQSVSEENYSLLNSHEFEEQKEENKNSSPATSELKFAKEQKNEVESKSPFDGIMLWTEQEAISKQVTMASSELSCCVAAFVNVMLVLKMQFSTEKVTEGIVTRLKSDAASIPQYLVSRSFGVVAQENLIRGIHNVSHGYLYARFFQMYPRRDIRLSHWLSHWMKKGAVPIATTNVQRDVTLDTPTLDSRHHQMIFGVNSKGIYLTNPMECVKDEELMWRLTNPSVLKIKRQEIVSRWSPDTNLKPLMFQNDARWKTMNVLGQVANIIRESPDPTGNEKFLTQDISIPASSGITLIIPRNCTGYEELVSAPDLPTYSSSKPE